MRSRNVGSSRGALLVVANKKGLKKSQVRLCSVQPAGDTTDAPSLRTRIDSPQTRRERTCTMLTKVPCRRQGGQHQPQEGIGPSWFGLGLSRDFLLQQSAVHGPSETWDSLASHIAVELCLRHSAFLCLGLLRRRCHTVQCSISPCCLAWLHTRPLDASAFASRACSAPRQLTWPTRRHSLM